MKRQKGRILFQVFLPDSDSEVPKISIDETVTFVPDKKGFGAKIKAHKYFAGVCIYIEARGETTEECAVNLIRSIVEHPSFNGDWREEKGANEYEVSVIDDDPFSQKVSHFKVSVIATSQEEARQKIKAYDQFLEITGVGLVLNSELKRA